MKKKQVLILVVFVVVITSISFGCSPPKQKDAKKDENMVVKPFQTSKQKFVRIVGWLNNDSVLVQAQQGKSTNFVNYNIYTGKEKPILAVDSLISDVQLSPDGSQFLVYAIQKNNKVNLSVHSTSDGSTLMSKEMEPLSANFYWNPDSINKIMMVLFDQNFAYTVNVIDTETSEISKVTTTSQFVSWYSDNLYVVNRKEPGIELGNLYLEDTREQEPESLIVANILQFAVSHNMLLTTERPDDPSKVTYDFRTIGFQTIYKYEMPREYDELGTFIPYFDKNFTAKTFLTFEPYESKKISPQGNEYRLVLINPEEKSHRVIVELMDNKPIVSSPDGQKVLYGYQFEQLISTKDGEISNLVSSSERIY
ncbi:hypothetical protein [Listeria sp. ILCC797]|uniref:YqgU-like beta propeller domain-containing protein n=1 Tax=Listeria sp. ILCC797 TaxID=1918333 RepID=UPI000B590C3B|nr:hypothetical protein [Listeria sp. ILCC797]